MALNSCYFDLVMCCVRISHCTFSNALFQIKSSDKWSFPDISVDGYYSLWYVAHAINAGFIISMILQELNTRKKAISAVERVNSLLCRKILSIFIILAHRFAKKN